MKAIIKAFLLKSILLAAITAKAETRYVGGDISLLPEYEAAGAQYKTPEGQSISDLLPWLHDQGMNAMRVRLFANPSRYHQPDKDPNACQNLDYIIPLCKQIKACGMALMLDFHYSDTWADPAHQWIPDDWAGLTDEQLCQKIYDYTRESLRRLGDEGIVPDFIQPGNEISFGMLWGTPDTPEEQLKKALNGSDANWERLGSLLKQAVRACREVCPEAKIVLHTERIEDIPSTDNFYNRMREMGVEYDIIGLSYYPYFHGPLSNLVEILDDVTTRFPDKNVMIVETGYSYKWEVPGTDRPVDYPYSETGQNQFVQDLVATLLKYDAVDGLFWWWMEYNAYGTSLSGWYNASLFDSTTGRACRALKTLCGFASGKAGIVPTVITPDSTRKWYDFSGRPIPAPTSPGIYIRDGEKVYVNENR